MAMVVRSNLMAYNANRQLGMNNSAVSKNLEKLSSGFKINRAADDAAGLAVSEKMKAQIKGLEQASLNSQDGISLVQTAEGALTEVHDMLNRMTELATKSANGTIQDDVDREAIQNEVNKLNEEIDRIADSTNFNGIKLLDGSLSGGGSAGASGINFKGKGITSSTQAAVAGVYKSDALTGVTGAAAGNTYSFSVTLSNGKTHTTDFTFDATNKKLIASNGTEYTTAANNAITAKEIADAVVGELGKVMGDAYTIANSGNAIEITANEAGTSTPKVIGFSENANGTAKAQKITETKAADAYKRLDMTTATMYDGTNGDASIFTINGKKFAFISDTQDTTKLDSNVNYVATAAIDNNAVVAMSKLINQKTGLSLDDAPTGTDIDLKSTGATVSGGGLTLQIGDTGENFNQVTVSVDNMKSNGIGTAGLDVSTQSSAKDSIQTIKDAINKVSTNRSEMGALQNRLEHTINNLDVTAENMTNANSRVRDTDMAKQMMEYTKMNVLTQSAQAMLAQANQNPQSILQLLQ